LMFQVVIVSRMAEAGNQMPDVRCRGASDASLPASEL
jgi:hypothetical protein